MAMDISMTDGPPASHNDSYEHSWQQDTVDTHQLVMSNTVCFATSDFGGAHSAFHMMITCPLLRHYGFLLRTLPPDIYRSYLANEGRAIRIAVFRIFGVSQNKQTLDQRSCAKREVSLSEEFGGLMSRS
jgi:hypothetical protein